MIERRITHDRITLRLPMPMGALSVWRALTGPEHIARWWGEQVRLQPRLGGRFSERWYREGRDKLTIGSVVAWEPPTEFAMSWSDDDWPAATELRVTLRDAETGSVMTLSHAGWRRLPANDRERLIAEHAEGWSRHLGALARYLSGN